MTIIHTIHEPFHYTDVSRIAEEMSSTGLEGLKDRVTTRVRKSIGVEKLPERISTWVHQICLRYTAPSAPHHIFRGKLAKPIDIRSLSGRRK